MAITNHERVSNFMAVEQDRKRPKFWRKPLDLDRIVIPRGELHIIAERCKGCAFCVEYCPCDVLEMSTEFNKKGYHPPRVKIAEKCVNCNLCEMVCPEFAIYSIEIKPEQNTAS
jgi:2-oxoglutarate ferredoxin oxidoreductase subunit delta